MPTRTGNRTELARFLRSRRDEVAELASMSTNYYERLEQARGPRPSPTVLDAIAGGLRLSVEEREHLYLLAEQPLPAQGGRRGELDAGLVTTMESLTATTIAMIVDDLGTVLARTGPEYSGSTRLSACLAAARRMSSPPILLPSIRLRSHSVVRLPGAKTLATARPPFLSRMAYGRMSCS